MSSKLTLTLVSLLGIATLAGCAGVTQRLKSAASSAQEQRAKKQAALPHCPRTIGAVAIAEPEHNWWTQIRLQSPEALIKLYVAKSGCFTLVDRGRAFDIAARERKLAASGDLRQGSNIGKGQIKAADYVITPDVVSQNEHAGGGSLFAVLGSMLDPTGLTGAVAGNLVLSDRKADVTLSVTDVRSSSQAVLAEGQAEKTDLGFGAGGLGFSGGDLIGAGVGSYANTQIGQVVAMAYLDAYTKMVEQLGGLPANASQANVEQAVAMTRTGHLFAEPAANSTRIRVLKTGTTLYPTGARSGAWWMVSDELGDRGWVDSHLLGQAK